MILKGIEMGKSWPGPNNKCHLQVVPKKLFPVCVAAAGSRRFKYHGFCTVMSQSDAWLLINGREKAK